MSFYNKNEQMSRCCTIRIILTLKRNDGKINNNDYEGGHDMAGINVEYINPFISAAQLS